MQRGQFVEQQRPAMPHMPQLDFTFIQLHAIDKVADEHPQRHQTHRSKNSQSHTGHDRQGVRPLESMLLRIFQKKPTEITGNGAEKNQRVKIP